ncbi:MAG: hydrogenase iron-sulfur subunit [Spirochaetales bacterium]|nr:hydrogenase iron-sulfur subunit [Spirochaetales bacterium]
MESVKKIVAFCCENSALQALDGVEDPSLFELVDIIRLPCSGKIESALILKALEAEREGVLVLGCPRDNCKYIKGNVRAEKRVDLVKKALKTIGYDPQIVQMDYLSVMDAHKFKYVVHRMADRLTGKLNTGESS